MALQKQNVPISLAGGIDTKTDSKLVVPGKLLTLENGIFTSSGQIQKRFGYEAITQLIEGLSTSITSGAGLANYKDELVILTGTKAYSLSESTQRLSDKGSVTNVSLSSKSVVRNTYQQTTCDSAFHSSGLEAFTWEDTRGGSRYSIIDSTTGEVIVSDLTLGANAVKPKPIALGNYIIILFYDTVLHHIRMLPIPVTQPSIPLTQTDVAINVNIANPNYDATVLGTRLFIAYNNTDGGAGGISVKYLDSFLTPSATLDVAGQAASSCISIFGDTTLQEIYVAYHNSTHIKYFVRSYSLTAILAPTIVEANGNTINNIAGATSNGSGTVYYTQNAGLTYNQFIKSGSITRTGTVTSVGIFLRSVGIAAKPFQYGGITYLPVAYESTLQPTYFILDNSARVVAKYADGVGGGLLKKNIVPESNTTSTGMYLIAALQKDLLTTISGAVYTQTGVQATSFDFATGRALNRVELGQNLHLTGGILSMYDGISFIEHGFNLYPENIVLTTNGAGGSIAAGQYQYAVTYEWMDNQGQTHYSAPSVPSQITTIGSTSTNTLVIPTLRITEKKGLRGSVIIGVYRTEANGMVFYKISSITSPTLNNTAVDTVNYVDTVIDSAIIGNPLLYTNGGIIENIAAPAASFVTVFKDRVILLPTENKNQWWYSKQVVPGAPVEFSDSFVKNIDQDGGDLVSGAKLDSLLILLKQNKLYYVSGQGPDNTGAQDDFSEPQAIVSDGGCIDKNSVVVMPSGLLYKSQKGIYLLDRKLETHYIGAPVEAFNNDTIVSATLIEKTTQVRFCLDTGTALVYDYYSDQWSTFTNHNAVDALNYDGQFTFLTATGMPLKESTTLYTDNGNPIKLRLTTAWLSLAGIQAYERIYRLLLLGDYKSPHQLLVQVAYDFNPTSMQDEYINAGALLEPDKYGDDATYGDSTVYGGAFPKYQFEVRLTRQKCETVQFTIEDVQSRPLVGEGFSLTSLALQVGVKKGLNKLPASRTFGSN